MYLIKKFNYQWLSTPQVFSFLPFGSSTEPNPFLHKQLNIPPGISFVFWATQRDHICFHAQLRVLKNSHWCVRHVRAWRCSPLMTKVSLQKLITNPKVLDCRGWGVSYIPYTNKNNKSQQFTSEVSQYSSKWFFYLPPSFSLTWMWINL